MHTHRPRLGASALVATILTSVVIGVLPANPVSAAGTKPASSATLSSHVLAISNMPTGWKSGSPGSRGLTTPNSTSFGSCFANMKHAPKGGSGVNATFSTSATLPTITETLGLGKAQKKDLALITGDFRHCKSISLPTGKNKTHAKLKSVSFPAAGRGAKAYVGTFTVSHNAFGILFVPFSAKPYVGIFGFVTVGNPVNATSIAFFTEARDKAEGKTVPAPPAPSPLPSPTTPST